MGLDITYYRNVRQASPEQIAAFNAMPAGGFRAGSYSGYNRWRSQLAAMAGLREGSCESGPFFELLHFADNEGVIGPVVSAKLALDFAEWQDRASVYASALSRDPTRDQKEGEWFLRKYGEWRVAFETAQHDGYVEFH